MHVDICIHLKLCKETRYIVCCNFIAIGTAQNNKTIIDSGNKDSKFVTTTAAIYMTRVGDVADREVSIVHGAVR